MSTNSTFSCPHCHNSLSIDDLMSSSIATQLRLESQEVLRIERERAKKTLFEQLAAKNAEIVEAQKTVEAAVRAKSEAEKQARDRQAQLDNEAQSLADQIVEKEKARLALQAKNSVSATIIDLESRLKAAEETANQSIELESGLRLKLRDAEAAAKLTKIELDRKLDDERSAAEQAGFAKASAEAKKQAEVLAHQNASLQAEIAELQRKAILGSQQAQGERLELQLEAMLKSLFPLDEVREVKKGNHGADVIQKVMSPTGKHLGTIIWETKNAQNWKNDWIDKLKADTRDANGQIGILVSSVVPKGCNGVELRDGVVVCDVKVADGIAAAMRNQIVEIAQARAVSEQKESLQATVYDYIAGQSRLFRRLEAVVTPLRDMRESLAKEQATADRIFASRETKIREMAKGLMGIYGDMHGMLGDAVPRVPQLEFEGE